MHIYVLFSLVGLGALALYKVLSIALTRIQNASKARQLNCQEAPMYPHCGFLGLKHIKQLQAADNANLFPNFMLATQNTMNEFTGRFCSTFRLSVLGQNGIFTSDPENIKAMLATQFQDFDLGKVRHDIMSDVLGEGIFVQDGKAWEHSRAMLRPNFAREQISDLEMEERHVQNLLAALPVQKDGWTATTDIQSLFFRLTMDASTELLFGESVNSQIAENPHLASDKPASNVHDERSFAINFDQAQLHMRKKFRLLNFHWLHNPKEYQKNKKIVNDFVQHFVDLALKRSNNKSNSNKPPEKPPEKARFVFLDALAQQTRNPSLLRGQILNILTAGRDTTASLLSWLFHELLLHPEIFHQLRTTILTHFGTPESPKQPLTFSTLKTCHYLQHVLNEVNRLHAIVPGNGRVSNKPTTLPRGGGPEGKFPIFIPAHQPVDYSVYVMHRRKDLWGEDAEEFRPERFEGRRSGWEFLPFNGGPRICLGQQFAVTEAGYVVVRLLQMFDRMEAGEGYLGSGEVECDLGLTMCPKRPVRVRLRQAMGEGEGSEGRGVRLIT